MKLYKLTLMLLILTLIGCEDSLNGPVGSDLIYEPIVLSVGEEADFGTINEDDIKVKISGIERGSYMLEYSNKYESCPLNANKRKLTFIMCDDKYEVTFDYSTSNDRIILQLFKYKIL